MLSVERGGLVRELVNHILYVADLNNKRVTNLQLHKLAYFTLGYIIRNDYIDLAKKLYIDEQFQVWLYGPVLPQTYSIYKIYNNNFIISKGDKSIELENIPELNKIILNLIDHNVFNLVEISHDHQFWKNNKQSIKKKVNVNYKFDDLLKEFSDE